MSSWNERNSSRPWTRSPKRHGGVASTTRFVRTAGLGTRRRGSSAWNVMAVCTDNGLVVRPLTNLDVLIGLPFRVDHKTGSRPAAHLFPHGHRLLPAHHQTRYADECAVDDLDSIAGQEVLHLI